MKIREKLEIIKKSKAAEKLKSLKKLKDINYKEEYKKYRELSRQKYLVVKDKVLAEWAVMQQDKKEMNRMLILGLSTVFILDYIMISYHIDKNIFNIFPSIPAIESKSGINIFIPSEGCREIISEKREINTDVDDEVLVKKLVALVAEGSYFENTSSNVPVKLLVKKIWLSEDENGGGRVCLVDISPVILERDIPIIKGSEQMFRDALEKTVKENIPGITRVILLEKGVPGRKLWEI